MTLRGRTVTVAPLRKADAPALFSAFHAAPTRCGITCPSGPFASDEETWPTGSPRRRVPRPAVLHLLAGRGGSGGVRQLPPDRACRRVHRGRLPLLLAPAAAQRGGDRGDVPDDEMGLRGRVSTLRVEVQRAERGVPARGGAPGPVLRGRVPAGDGGEGAQPRHRVVRRHRREWPALEAAFQTWLAPENFDADGRQKTSLRDLTASRSSSQGIPR
jgi:hypothetical protein